MDREKKALDLFATVCDLPPEERSAFLDKACAGDGALRSEVDSLLARDVETPPFVDRFHGILGQLGDAAGQAMPAVIGPYRILDIVGQGGMGLVYKAEQEDPRRIVALKVLRPGLTTPDQLRRFKSEAQMLGQLHHSGIAQVYEAGTADTDFGVQPFFAMEFIDGRPLNAFAAEKRLTVRQRLRLFVKVCRAVQHAHQSGIIHRDLKPGNILVDNAGEPKILDFGIGRFLDPDLARTVQTEQGQVLGTLPYISPEQIGDHPEAADTRSDIYSLGVMLFELLAGRMPIDVSGKSLPEAARIIEEDDPPLLGRIDRGYRGDLETITAKSLEKD